MSRYTVVYSDLRGLAAGRLYRNTPRCIATGDKDLRLGLCRNMASQACHTANQLAAHACDTTTCTRHMATIRRWGACDTTLWAPRHGAQGRRPRHARHRAQGRVGARCDTVGIGHDTAGPWLKHDVGGRHNTTRRACAWARLCAPRCAGWAVCVHTMHLTSF